MEAEIVVENTEKHRMQLARFVHGTLNHKCAEDLTGCLLGRTDAGDRRSLQQNILVAESPHMAYLGKTFGATAAQKVQKYYVGLLDKKTGKMQICDSQVFNMHPHIQGEEKEDINLGDKTYSEKNDLLTRAFGSAKRKKALESRQRNKVSDEVLQGVLNTTIDHGIEQAKTYKEKQENLPAGDEFSIIPSCNVDAERVEDVYRLSDILSDGDMDALHHNATPLFECTEEQIATWKEEEKFPNYVAARLSSMPVSEEPRWVKCKCLLYLSYLMQMYKMKAKQLSLRDPLPADWPGAIKNKLLREFTLDMQIGGRKRRCCPSRLKDKLLSYILTLCLLMDEFMIELVTMQRDLLMSKQKLEMHMKALGCKLETKTMDKERISVAVLKIPVVLPVAQSAPRRTR